jgi:uncharacterized membrane protein
MPASTRETMSNFRLVVEILAPPERVWAVLLDVERWPDWTPTVTSAKRLDDGPLAVGSQTKLVQPKLAPAIWRVTELDERKGLFVWATSRPGITVMGSHLIERSANGSRLTDELRYSGLLGPFMAMLLKKLNREYLAAEAQGLKRRCENAQ